MGISNREWLYSLDVADLAEWFDSEHVEDAISENLGLSQDSEIDTREKLEADVLDYQGAWPLTDSTPIDVTWGIVRGWLNRQAAITKRELCKQQETLAQRMIVDGYEFELFEMRKQISELTAERDELQARVNELEAELCAREKYPDGFMSVNEMRKELGDLQANVTDLQIQLEAMSDVANDYRFERDELQDRVDTLTRYIHDIKQIARKV